MFFVNKVKKIDLIIIEPIMKNVIYFIITMKGICSICDATVTLPKNTEESEIINCSDCKSRLVVQKIMNGKVTLEQAPVVEEDWGQ